MEERNEKKKRWRPSLTAYRELEEVIHRQCMELDGWREKYRGLLDGDAVARERDGLKGEVDRLLGVIEARDRELESVRDANKSIRELNENLCDEIEYLKNRGFFARLFNKI